MLRCYVLEFKGKWDQLLPLIEFSNNNSYHLVIKVASYEALYGRKCIAPHCWQDPKEKIKIGLELIHEITERVKVFQERIKATNNREEAYATKKEREI